MRSSFAAVVVREICALHFSLYFIIYPARSIQQSARFIDITAFRGIGDISLALYLLLVRLLHAHMHFLLRSRIFLFSLYVYSIFFSPLVESFDFRLHFHSSEIILEIIKSSISRYPWDPCERGRGKMCAKFRNCVSWTRTSRRYFGAASHYDITANTSRTWSAFWYCPSCLLRIYKIRNHEEDVGTVLSDVTAFRNHWWFSGNIYRRQYIMQDVRSPMSFDTIEISRAIKNNIKAKKKCKNFWNIDIAFFRVHAAEIFEETGYKLKLIVNAAACYYIVWHTAPSILILTNAISMIT